MRAIAAAALAALAACTIEGEVLDDPLGVIVSCDDAWTRGAPRAPCAFDGVCDRASPEAPCCTEYGYCTEAGLVLDAVCDPSCACSRDAGCAYGAEVCDGGRCEPCPPTEICPPCPDVWVRLTRNGCETCECAPPAECEVPGEPCGRTEPEICYAGATCALGCDPGDPGCCTTTCSAVGCEEPAPVGCLIDCAPDTGCATCAADACECVDGVWTCTPICVGELAFTCVAP